MCKGWARTWARHVVVKHAIRILANHYGSLPAMLADSESISAGSDSGNFAPMELAEYKGIFALRNLDRIVFVLCVLEEYSTHECALLLGTSQRDVVEAQSRATEQIVQFGRDLFRETKRRDSVSLDETTSKHSDTPREWIRFFGCVSNGDADPHFSSSSNETDSCGALLS